MNSTEPRWTGALIGCGFVSQFHLAGWARVQDARLAALCDLDPHRLEQAGAKVPGARLYRDAATLFGTEPDLGFVEICTRPDSHLPLVKLAAKHGVHVLCQKPAATVRADLEAMIAAADAAGIRLMFHENWRFRAWYRAVPGPRSSRGPSAGRSASGSPTATPGPCVPRATTTSPTSGPCPG